MDYVVGLNLHEVKQQSVQCWHGDHGDYKRAAIGTNDGEVQSVVVAEDMLYRMRLLWAEMHGAQADDDNYYRRANNEVKIVPGVLGTDSKGGYDAIHLNESANLRLSNARAAVQAYQLKESINRDKTLLLWIAGDWNLSDALSKKAQEFRQGLLLFLRAYLWKLKYDPEFVASARKAKKLGKAAQDEMNKTSNDHVMTFTDIMDKFDTLD